MSLIRTTFAYPLGLALLLVLLALTLLAFVAARRRRRALAALGSRPVLSTLAGSRRGLGLLRVFWLGLGWLFLVVGIAGPRWGRSWEGSAGTGRDLVLVIDLSRSMLAQDVLPSRVERAKQALEDLTDTVQQGGGHRLAVVAFAARPRLVCPLTHDYDHVRTALAALDAVYLHPELRPAGKDAVSGTRIGAALIRAVQTHDPRRRGLQDILLISDGDDPATDEEWREGSLAAREFHVPVHTVGLGDPVRGSPVPLHGEAVLRHDNQVVLTRLNERPLKAIAEMTGGSYTPARTDTLHLGTLFRERIEPGTVHEDSEELLPVHQQRYLWFFASAFLLLGMDTMIGRRRTRRTRW
jgi:Ca-activated chloride channel family protein